MNIKGDLLCTFLQDAIYWIKVSSVPVCEVCTPQTRPSSAFIIKINGKVEQLNGNSLIQPITEHLDCLSHSWRPIQSLVVGGACYCTLRCHNIKKTTYFETLFMIYGEYKKWEGGFLSLYGGCVHHVQMQCKSKLKSKKKLVQIYKSKFC